MIADVVMHVSYTARDGGPDLKADVRTGLLDALNDLKPRRLFSLRQEFPDAWNQLINAGAGPTRTCPNGRRFLIALNLGFELQSVEPAGLT
jgi:hypothetical protein